MCARCRVRCECVAFALRTHQAHGVMGGLSEQERYPISSSEPFGRDPTRPVSEPDQLLLNCLDEAAGPQTNASGTT